MLEPFQERLIRFGIGLAAFLALAIFLWPNDIEALDRTLGVAFLSSFALWLVAEARSLLRRAQHPHDIEFIKSLRQTIPLETIRFLQQQDFGVTYDDNRLDGLWKVDFEAPTVGYGPHDKVLKRQFDDFKNRLREFGLLLATNGGPIRANTQLSTIVPDRERARDEFSERTSALVKKANAMADDVVRLFDKLMQTAKKRVPVAFSNHGELR